MYLSSIDAIGHKRWEVGSVIFALYNTTYFPSLMAQIKKVYVMFTVQGEMIGGFSNMKKAYTYLLENNWLDSVNYSHFSRTINKPSNFRYWHFVQKDFNSTWSNTLKVWFEPLLIS